MVEVQTCMETWAKNAKARDIDATVGMYDPEMGRLLGTVDEAESPRRDSIEKIREYFNGFLGGNQAVKPSFPKFDKDDVFFLAEDTAVYSGYYKFALTKEGVTKDVYPLPSSSTWYLRFSSRMIEPGAGSAHAAS